MDKIIYFETKYGKQVDPKLLYAKDSNGTAFKSWSFQTLFTMIKWIIWFF